MFNISVITKIFYSKESIVFINNDLAASLGFTQDELIGTTILDLVHGEDLQVEDDLVNFMYEPHIDTFEKQIVRITHKIGSAYLHMEISGKKITRGRRTFAIFLFKEVSLRKQAELARFERQRFIEMTFEHIQDDIYVIDEDFIIQNINRNNSTLIGKSITSLVSEHDVNSLRLTLRIALERLNHREIQLADTTNSRDLNIKVVPLPSSIFEKKQIMVTFKDITEKEKNFGLSTRIVRDLQRDLQ